MKVVITGATGFIGNAVLKNLSDDKDNEIWVVVRPDSMNLSKLPNKRNIHVEYLRLEDISKLKEKVNSIDVFIHCAWDGVRGIKRNSMDIQDENYKCGMNILRLLPLLDCKKFIGLGSQAEYGVMNGEIGEEYPCNPTTEYGKAKLKLCMDGMQFCKEHNISFVWLRVFSVYGIDDFEDSLIMTCISKMKKNEPIELTSCEQEWDYININDVVELIRKIAEEYDGTDVFNVASGRHMQLKCFIETMRTYLGSKCELRYGAISYPNNQVVSFMPSIILIEDKLKWKPRVSFENGIKDVIDYYEKN